MAHTFTQLQSQIARLQAEAEKLKAAEVAGVIAKVKDAISAYGLTRSDLFGAQAQSPVRRKASGAAKSKFADGKGNTWVGRGPRPQWLRDALKAGAALADFASSTTSDPTGAGAGTRDVKKPAARKAGAKKAGRAKYHDGAGQTWSGRGPKPKWLKAAIASGRKLEDLAV